MCSLNAMSLTDTILDTSSSLVGRAVGRLRDLSARLGPDDDWIEQLRRGLFVGLDPFTRKIGRPLIRKKGRADYVCTINASEDEVENALSASYQRNLSSTRKYRIKNDHRDWAVGSWVNDPEDTPWQHHVYLFQNEDGTVDLYAHKEPSAEFDPEGHVSKKQIHGDPDRIARTILEENNISYE